MAKYRPWLFAAAAYNLAWGGTVAVAPSVLGAGDHVSWRIVGMLVAVYAPAYFWAARYPERHAHLVAVALLGKALGPLGFLWALGAGELPARFAATIVTNDLVWWPAFALLLRDAARLRGGWRPLLAGR